MLPARARPPLPERPLRRVLVLSISDLLWRGHSGHDLSHEGVICRRPVGEARERSRGFPDAAGHGQGLGAERGGHGQVGELGVKVSQVCRARLGKG